jgi:hypothetical protein
MWSWCARRGMIVVLVGERKVETVHRCWFWGTVHTSSLGSTHLVESFDFRLIKSVRHGTNDIRLLSKSQNHTQKKVLLE